MEPTNPTEPQNEQPNVPESGQVIRPESSPAPAENAPIVSEPAPEMQPQQPAEPIAPTVEPVSTPSFTQPMSPETNQPAYQAPVVGAPEPIAPPAPMGPMPMPAQKKSKKKLLFIGLGVAVVILLSGGFVFGYYLPNQPQAVYNKAMSQSGQAADKVVSYAQSQLSTETTAAKLDGTMAVKTSGVSFDASMNGEVAANSMKLSLDANIEGEKASLEVRAVDVKTSENPDIYLKVSGVKSYLDSLGSPELSKLDGQWIAIDHTMLDTYQKLLESYAGASASNAPTTAQINDAVSKVQTVNKEYLFTANKDKAVVTYKSFVGAETKNGRKVNHYTVGYSKANLNAYVDALAKALDASSLNTWVKSQNDGKSASELLQVDQMHSTINGLKGDETFDLYVDTQTKLVQSITFTDKSADSPGTLTIAQNYTGGSVYPFEISTNITGGDSPSTMDLKLSADTQTNKLTLQLNVDSKSKSDPSTLDFKASLTPTKDTVTVTAPTGAKPVLEVLQGLGIDPSLLTGIMDSAGTSSGTDVLPTVNS